MTDKNKDPAGWELDAYIEDQIGGVGTRESFAAIAGVVAGVALELARPAVQTIGNCFSRIMRM